MYLSDEQIINLLTEYVTDERYKQAILIDGDWGSGKTYFIQEKLVEELNSKIGQDTEYKRSVFYISLYGMENCTQIIDGIYTASLESFFDEKLGDGKGEKIGKGINFASKLITAGIKHFNIDSKDLPSISDIKKIKNAVVIFDDLERCTLDINQLLGFINNLVEHNEIKVIIVANQSEIGKARLVNDLPQKYSVVLNPHLKLKESEQKKNAGRQASEIDQIAVNELQEYTEQIFSQDLVYDKVKEKLIGLTINYRANFDNIYKEIIEKYIKNEPAKERLAASKPLVLTAFDKYHHNNIRTLIFSLMAYERIFIAMSEMNFEPIKFIDEQYTKILRYVLEASIQIKRGQELYSWTNSTVKTGIVYLGKKGIYGDGVFGYRFVDTYLTTRFFDPEEAKSIVLSLMTEASELEKSREADNALSFNKLWTWWYLEDEEIVKLLDASLTELSEMKYHPRYFKDMIILLMRLNHNKFSPFDYKLFCGKFVDLMKQRLVHDADEFDIEHLEILSTDQDTICEYNAIMRPIFDMLTEKKIAKNEELNNNFDLDESWGDAFKTICAEKRSSYLMEKKFLFYIIPKKVIDKIRTSKVQDIHDFSDGIKEVYSFSNLNDFFKDDLNHLNELMEMIDINELSQGKHTRRIALDKLKNILEESKKLIEQ